MIGFLLEMRLNDKRFNLIDDFIKKPSFAYHYSSVELEFLVWGDPIFSERFANKLERFQSVEFIVNNLYGHYYYSLYRKREHETILGNSLFGILPLYYQLSDKKLVVSENALTIGDHSGISKLSRRFILENILFNYSLSDHSILEGVMLLPVNSYISISDKGIKLIKHTNIENYFSSDPAPHRKTIDNLTNTFLETTKKYLPEKRYIHALTGGLDGRTLVSVALYYNKDFSCYCFGKNDSEDTKISSLLAGKANVPIIKINLDEHYSKNESLKNGHEFILNSSGTGTFTRAHYLYAAKQLIKSANHVISGNFGSEIFRAAHILGVLISPNLYKLFAARNFSKAIKNIESATEWDFLNKKEYRREWSDLQEEFKKFPSFNPDYKNLSKNQQFYKIVFEEIFRKYYGAEMVNQYYYIYNRTPFLDIDFLKTILRSNLAGVQSDFFTHNPIKRYKGQILYAQIIKKTYPDFGREILDKGYSPDDLLSSYGKIKISISFLVKRIKRTILFSADPNAVLNSFKNNLDYWKNLDIDQNYFNPDKIRRTINICDFDNTLNIALTQAWLKNNRVQKDVTERDRNTVLK